MYNDLARALIEPSISFERGMGDGEMPHVSGLTIPE